MKVLLDSDALFSLYVTSDVHHQNAKAIFEKLLQEKKELFITNLVLQETTTVLSYRFGQKQATDFLSRFDKTGIKQIFMGEKLTVKSWEIFKKQQKKGTSFVDCANIATYQEIKAEEIMSFDRFYQRKGLKVTT